MILLIEEIEGLHSSFIDAGFQFWVLSFILTDSLCSVSIVRSEFSSLSISVSSSDILARFVDDI